MIIDLRELLHASGRIEGAVLSHLDDPVGGDVVVPCQVTVDYRFSQGMFYFHGSVAGEFATACHRCLAPVATRISGEFDLIVRRSEHEGEFGEDVMTLATHEHEVSIDPWVHETVVVNEPMIVLCREDCKGLCPTCGTDLNTGTCNCESGDDPRWDALRRMKLD
ncbi:MAG TPA: DUF177 domain-containing protein [Candidatus Krumholzibacteria bacterium]|nr:DUF177 domain-containing protein [Candidatus Krumholzibacteria bacterium]